MIIAAHTFQVIGLILAGTAIGLLCELIREHTQVGSDIDREDGD